MNFEINLNSSYIQPDPSSYIEGQKMTIQSLPRDVILSIFYHLKAPHLGIIRLVDKTWSQTAKDETLWKALYQRDSALFKTDSQVKSKETWFQTYQEAWTKYMSDDTEFVRSQVQKDGLYLKYASDRLKDDLETVKLAVQQNGLALQFVSDRLKKNRDVVRLAIQQNGLALQYALHHRNDLEIVVSAILQNKQAITWAGAFMEYHPAIRHILNPNAKSFADDYPVINKKKTVKEKNYSSQVNQKKQSHSAAKHNKKQVFNKKH